VKLDVQQILEAAKIEAALETPEYFIARYFADGNVIKHMEKFHAEWWRLADEHKRVMVLAPRDHAKTTVLAIWYTIYTLCKWRWEKLHGKPVSDPRIGILSDTEGQAEDILRAVVINLETNAKLIADFGQWRPLSPRKWTNLAIIVEGWEASNDKDVTVYAGGYESAWLGKRFDLLITDDLTNLKRNSATQTARENLEKWWKEVVVNCLEEHSALVYSATMQHHQDLTNKIIQEERTRKKTGEPPVWTIRKYKAVLAYPTSVSAPRVLWPEKWSFDRLMDRKREIGTVAFEKMYQNIAVNEDLLCFRPNFLERCKDTSIRAGEVGEGWRIFIGVDPAIGMSGMSSFFAMVALGAVKGSDRLYVLDIFRDRISIKSQVEWINAWYEKYQPVQVRIETNAYQSALKQVLRDKYPRINAVPHFTAKNKVDPETGIVSMCAPLVENGLLRIPWGSPESHRKMEQFIDELETWPQGEHDDLPMALWIAATAVREAMGKIFARSGEWGTTVKNPLYDTRPKLPEEEIFRPEIDPARGGKVIRVAPGEEWFVPEVEGQEAVVTASRRKWDVLIPGAPYPRIQRVV
jgi:phage terminase large subunit-like protein